MEKKKKRTASDYSKDAFLTNPVVSVNEHTGMTPRVPADFEEANSLADMLDVPVTSDDESEAMSQKR
ncbi:MAG: hypothetical protein IJC50_08635 [Clostridia bacterium]|nr:hypothetical protein [Clostridia bacterium]